MNSFSLLRPEALRIYRAAASKSRSVKIILSLLVVSISVLMYLGLYKFFTFITNNNYTESLPIVGSVFSYIVLSKLLELLFIALFFMLLLSSVVSAFAELYLDDNLVTLMVSPLPSRVIFNSRFISMTVNSSWMTVFFFAPVFLAFASAMKTSGQGLVIFSVYLFFYILIPNIIGAAFALILSSLFPVRQMKRVFQFFSAILLTCIIFFIRSMELEKLVNMKHFEAMSGYLASFTIPYNSYTPAGWMHKASLSLFNQGYEDSLYQFLPIFLFTVLGLVFINFLAYFFYRKSWQRSVEARDNKILSLELLRKIIIFPFKFMPKDFEVIASKEITTFLRDPAIFSQIFMIAAIIAIYGYNLSIIPLKEIPVAYSSFMNNMLVYLNGPFIGFILSAIAMRFVFPSISTEGKAFWVLKASPLKPKRIMVIKFIFYLVPMLTLGLILCALTNSMFTVSSPYLLYLSFFNVILSAFVITSLAIGTGTVFADFKSDTAIKAAGSYGGFVFMVLSGLYILNLVIPELYIIHKLNFLAKNSIYRGYMGNTFLWCSVILIILGTIIWVYVPFKKGLEKIDYYEPQ